MKKLIAIAALIFMTAFLHVYSQPIINSVTDSPDPVEVPGYNNITANVTNATMVYVEIYYPNNTLKGNYSMNYISPSTWYYNDTYAYPMPLGVYNYTVKAYNSSGWSNYSGNFTLQDTTSPTSSVDTIYPYWHNSSVLIKATASDNYAVANVTLYYRFSSDNSSWNTWQAFEKDETLPWQWNFNFPDGEGYYEFYSIANDTSSNTESKAAAEAMAAYDVTPPTSSIDSIPYWHNSSILINASVSDNFGISNVTLYYRFSSDNITFGPWTKYSTDTASPWQWLFNHPNGEGYYEFYTIAYDYAGNHESKATADEDAGFDLNPPITTISASPSYGSYVKKNSLFTLSSIDAVSGVMSTYYRIWNGSWHPVPGSGVGIGNNFYIYVAPFYLYKEGINYIEYYSKDLVGNVESIHNVTYIVDETPPSISNINANPPSQEKGKKVNISCIVADFECGVDEVYVEIKYPDSSTSNFTMHKLNGGIYYRNETYTAVGTYYFSIYAKDNLGNGQKSSLYSFSIYEENLPPVTECYLNPPTPDGKNGWYVSNVIVTLNATDPEGDAIAYTKYRIDYGSWLTYTAPFTISDGIHIIQFYSADIHGNVEDIKSISIKIDTTKPTIILIRPQQGYLYILDRQICMLPSGNTIIIGRISVKAIAHDVDSDIENVSFYVNGILQNIDIAPPYEWMWRGDIGYKYLEAVAYNKAGLQQASPKVFLFIFSL